MSDQSWGPGDLMTLAQRGRHEEALHAAQQALADPATAPDERVDLLYALAIAHLFAGRWADSARASTMCEAEAAQTGSIGWRANALALRAAAREREDAPEAALDDLIEAETLLERCDDPGLRNWAHSGLGTCYGALRLYELALPHFEAATVIPEQAVDYGDGKTVDYFNLADLHLRWSNEMERLGLDEAQRAAEHRRHLDDALRWIEIGDAATVDDRSDAWRNAFTRMRAQVQSSLDPAAALPLLTELLTDGPDTDDTVTHAVHLARALRMLGETVSALEAARRAIGLLEQVPNHEPGTALDAWHQLHEAQLAAGVDGSVAIDAYVRRCAHELWVQRQRSVEGVRARRDYALLQAMHAESSRLAREDALTGLANRRALDEWLLVHHTGPATLVMVDLDRFKQVNDTFGHEVGDRVLRAVAEALRSTAREQDLLVRFGGDEFVVAMPGHLADVEAVRRRMRGAVDQLSLHELACGLEVRISVGAATAADGEPTADLLGRADVDMFDRKRLPRAAG